MDWSYLAGFLDGEGSIIIKPPRVRLYLSNTCREVLEEVKKMVKCGSIYEIKRKNLMWKRQYGWTICNHNDVLRILKKIENQLIIKKTLCKKAINYIESKRWQGYYLSKEELQELKHLGSSRKIAKLLGVSQFSVLKYMKRYGLFKNN